MKSDENSTSIANRVGQIAWVVPDINLTEKFFREVIGIPNFVKMENLRAEEVEGTYYGERGDYTFHLFMAISGDTLIELIQPVSGSSIFDDYLRKNPAGGVQHIAYVVAESELPTVISQFNDKGYPVIQSLRLPVASVAYFDTYKDIGVATEIIGVTEAGSAFVAQLKNEAKMAAA